MFLDDFTREDINFTLSLCSIQDTACVYDYLVTRNETFANYTKTINWLAEEDFARSRM